jgi:Na+/H+-dicarboxylate symporter
MIASIVDTDALLEVIWVSIAAGIGLTAVYGVAIVGASRALDSGRQGHTVGAVLYGAIGVLALAVVVVAIVLGIESLSDK